jgi:hypothetical protein
MTNKDRDYEEQGSTQLLPADMRQLRVSLVQVKNHDVIKLQTWVIAIVSTLLFLRFDEFCTMSGDDFVIPCSEIRKEAIEHLVVKVCGKTDVKNVFLKLVADHEYPELCPVRHLLVYLHLIGWKGGFLFPSEEELSSPPSDGIFTTRIDYKPFLKHIQRLCNDVLLQRPGLDKIGCHTFRKTGYCLAIFGEANRDDLKKSARHSPSGKDAPSYSKDADANFASHLRNPQECNAVQKWRNIRIENAGNAQAMAAYAGNEAIPMHGLPNYFITQILGVKEHHVYFRNQAFLIREALKRSGAVDVRVRMKKFLVDLSPQQEREFRFLLTMFLHEEKEKWQKQNPAATPREVLEHHPSVQAPVEVDTSAAGDDSRKRPRVDLENDLDDRHLLKDLLTAREKIQLMMKIDQERKTCGKLTKKAKEFHKKFVKPAVNCCVDHCGGNVDLFAQKWPGFQHTSFPTSCCSGKGGRGASCSPK